MTVRLESHGTARVVRIDRDHARNALDSATMDSIIEAAGRIANDPEARAIVLATYGSTFVAGGDLKEFGALTGEAGGQTVARKGLAMIDALRGCALPLIAAIDGDAYGGGCEVASACDLRFCSSTARLHWVQNKLAVTTGWGATARLVAIVGRSTATRWLLSAATVSADEALAAGFVDGVADAARGQSAEQLALAFCATFDGIDPAVTREQLALLRDGQESPQSRAREESAFARTWALEAHERAVRRFLARRR